MDKMMVLKLLILMFPAVIFLQAGLDKLFNMKSNAQYIQSVFEKTVLSRQASLLFVVLVILELASGLNAMAGAVLLYISGDASLGYVGEHDADVLVAVIVSKVDDEDRKGILLCKVLDEA